MRVTEIASVYPLQKALLKTLSLSLYSNAVNPVVLSLPFYSEEAEVGELTEQPPETKPVPFSPAPFLTPGPVPSLLFWLPMSLQPPFSRPQVSM